MPFKIFNRLLADQCLQKDLAGQKPRREATMIKSPGVTRAMVPDLALAPSLPNLLQDLEYSIGISLYIFHGVAAAVHILAGSSSSVVEDILAALTSAGSFTLGLFISSSVTPVSTFVSPMTGGSPFFTNSYKPRYTYQPFPFLTSVESNETKPTRQFIPSQPHRIPNNLFVQLSLNLKNNLAHRHPCSPVVKTPFSLAHANFIPTSVHASVRCHSCIQPISLSSQTLLDCFGASR